MRTCSQRNMQNHMQWQQTWGPSWWGALQVRQANEEAHHQPITVPVLQAAFLSLEPTLLGRPNAMGRHYGVLFGPFSTCGARTKANLPTTLGPYSRTPKYINCLLIDMFKNTDAKSNVMFPWLWFRGARRTPETL